jgi:signal transduction histidine kinase
MKLRSLLGLLAIGVLALPMALVILARVFFGFGSRSEASVPRSIAAYQAFMEVLDKRDPAKLQAKPGKAIPEWMDLIVADSGGKVIFSDQSFVPIGSVIGPGQESAIALAPKIGYRIMSESFTLNGKFAGTYAMRYKTELISLTSDPAAPFIALLLLLALAAIAFTFSGILSARIAAAFRKLEQAAQAIAAGDLESAVPESKNGVREISSLAGAMETMRASIKGDRARRARFLAAVSHDLRTPLTSVKGYLEAIDDGMAEDSQTLGRYVAIMRGKTSLLEDRVNELLDFARMSTSEWKLRLSEIDIGEFLLKLCAAYREDALSASRGFEFDVDGSLGLKLHADPKMLARALENVFQNALRYSPAGSTVSLEARRGPDAAEIVFTDSGPGIPADELGRIFDPYFRGKASSGEGEGLGLSISRSILQDHGWDIKAASPPEGGSRFTITMPFPKP